MQYFFTLWLTILLTLTTSYGNQDQSVQLVKSYELWRSSMIKKDVRLWQDSISNTRKQEIKNMIYSEKRRFPAAVFAHPFPPPAASSLKLLQAKTAGSSAKSVFFGEVDFGVGGKPTKNLLVVSSTHESGRWKFDTAEYVNLSGLKDVRTELEAGDLSYLNQPDFLPSASRPQAPLISLKAPVKYIAKVYAYCPGREIRTMVNKRSNHLFQNTKEAEVVIGGGLDGRNEVQFAIKKLPGSTGKEPLCLRVYLFSQVAGVKPIKIYEYLVPEGEQPKPYLTEYFNIERQHANTLSGKEK